MSLARLLSPRLLQRVFRTRADDTLPIAIEHRRIYIQPTRRAWAFLGSLLLMLVASINYALSLGYALSFLLTGLFAASLLQTYRNLAGLNVRNIDTASAFAGSPLRFGITLASPGNLPRHGIRVCTRESPTAASGDVLCSLDGHDEATFDLHVASSRRGLHALGRLTLESDWPLGLWRAWSYVHATADGLVFPAPEAEPPPLPADTSGDGEGHGSRAERGDVAGLRAYVAGDEPGTIAWKTLARGQGLHVRTFDTDGGIARTRLTLASTAVHGVEVQLSRLAAWILQAEATRADYSLELPDCSLPSTSGPAQQLAALSALARHGS